MNPLKTFAATIGATAIIAGAPAIASAATVVPAAAITTTSLGDTTSATTTVIGRVRGTFLPQQLLPDGTYAFPNGLVALHDRIHTSAAEPSGVNTSLQLPANERTNGLMRTTLPDGSSS